MLGALTTLLFCLGIAGLGRWAFGRWLLVLDPVARLPVAGMLGLASVGTLTLFIGLAPGGLAWGLYPVGLLGLVGLVLLWRYRAEIMPIKPEGYEWAFIAAIGLGMLFALVSVLAPSDTGDWDTLSHHLASTKLWIEQGQIAPIRFMHQSNFPFSVDNLFIWGQEWGGQAGAKMFMLVFLGFGIRAIFGLAMQLYGRSRAWWAALLFATIPVVLWESGTAYIDVAHGLFAGLALLFGCMFMSSSLGAQTIADNGRGPDSRWLWLSGLCLGFAMGTKYTGLQTLLVCGLTMLVLGLKTLRTSGALKTAFGAAALALAIASPWYVKNYIWNGNPVYPFFYEQLGGRNWDERRAATYTNEQRTFGVGRNQIDGTPEPDIDKTQVGHGILGLAYQPGRYINPLQTKGFGEPLGAVGVPLIAVFLLSLIRGRGRTPNTQYPALAAPLLFAVGLSLLIWFVLSQQSRYITGIAPPLAVLCAGLVDWAAVGLILRVVIVGQAAFTLFLMKTRRFDAQMPVVAGKITREDYQTALIPFYEPAQRINEIVQGGKVALYDEVFGYLLDVPYIWANPGHSLIIPYDRLQTGAQFADELIRQGFTHVYVSSMARLSEMLANPLTPDALNAMMNNWEIKWKVLIVDAVAAGRLAPSGNWRGGALFEVR